MSLPKFRPDPKVAGPMVVVAGRSNVGKSSFINMLLRRKNLARTSRTPGRTQLLNFFDVDAAFILADVPGYGYAKAPIEEVRRWTANVRGLVSEAPQLAAVVQLLDVRREPSIDDHVFSDLVKKQGAPLLYVLTKADKLARGKQASMRRTIAKELGVGADAVILTSSQEGTGRDEVWAKLLELVRNCANNGAAGAVAQTDGGPGAADDFDTGEQ